GGVITIAAAEPTLTGTSGYFSIKNGIVQSGSDSYTYSNIFGGVVNLAGNVTGNQVSVLAGGNISVAGAVTGTNGVTVTTFGGSTAGGAGSINSTGTISLNLGTAPLFLGTSSGFITVTQSAAVLLIGTAPSSLTSLSISSASDITTTSDITVGSAGTGQLS